MRFITKRALPRRTFLRGAGVALGLPLLDAMGAALSALADTPAAVASRLGFIYMPNGVAKNSSHRLLDAIHRRTELPDVADPGAARTVPRSVARRERPRPEPGGSGNDGASGDHTCGTSCG